MGNEREENTLLNTNFRCHKRIQTENSLKDNKVLSYFKFKDKMVFNKTFSALNI